MFWYLEWKRFFKKTSEVQTSNMNWRKKNMVDGGEGGIAVVVVGAWKGSGRWTETLSVTFSWVIWIDRPTL